MEISKKNNYRSLRPFLAEHVKYNYSISLIPSYMEKIKLLEDENQRLKSANGIGSVSNQLNHISSKVDFLISQQRDGWAHDRFNVLHTKLDHLTSQQREGWAHDRFEALFRKMNDLNKSNDSFLRKLSNKLKRFVR